MTEQTFPFGGTAVAEPPAPVLPMGGDDTADDGNRRKLMMVGGAAGALVLLIAAFFLLKGGGSSGNAPFVAPHHAPASGATTGATGGASKPVALPKQFKGTVGRDPFKALYVAPVGGGTGTSTTATSTTPSTSGATSTATTGTTSGTTTSSGTTATTATFHPVWLQLKSVYGTKWANFVVGYSNGKTLKTVNYFHVFAPTSSNRTVFANVFALLAIHNGEATVQYGDGTPVDIAPGAGSRLTVA